MATGSAATFLFADIAGFTALTEAHGDEHAVQLVDDSAAVVQAELPTVGGEYVKTVGDALMLRVPNPGEATLNNSGDGSAFGYAFFPAMLSFVVWTVATSLARYRTLTR